MAGFWAEPLKCNRIKKTFSFFLDFSELLLCKCITMDLGRTDYCLNSTSFYIGNFIFRFSWDQSIFSHCVKIMFIKRFSKEDKRALEKNDYKGLLKQITKNMKVIYAMVHISDLVQNSFGRVKIFKFTINNI